MKVEKICLYLILGIITTIIVSIFDYSVFNSNELFLISVILLGLLVLLFIILLVLRKVNPSAYEKVLNIFFEEDDFDGEKYVDDLRNKIINSSLVIKNKNDEKNTDILELMLENMKEIRDYYVISKMQSKKAFSLAVSMFILGFLLILTSIILSVIFKISLLITSIPAIGGMVSELIAGTSLLVYKASLEQLNNYYESLHNNERFLSLVNLVSKISSDKQDEVYINIINVELQNYRNKNSN